MIPKVLARLQRLQREMTAVSKSVFNSHSGYGIALMGGRRFR